MAPTAREVPFDLEPETDNIATHVAKGWAPENRATARRTMHVAGQGFAGQAQRCTQCGEILIAAVDDEDAESNYFPLGTRVGIDCPAGRRDAAHH